MSQGWVLRNQGGCEEVGDTDNIFALTAAGFSPMEKKWPVWPADNQAAQSKSLLNRALQMCSMQPAVMRFMLLQW